MSTALFWLRDDLRLEDNPALSAAAQCDKLIILYIWDESTDNDWPVGAASRAWLRRSLQAFAQQLTELGQQLVIRQGNSLDVLQSVIATEAVDQVHWNRRYTPAGIALDKTIKAELKAAEITVESHRGNLVFEPWEIGDNGNPVRVFTPFWKRCQKAGLKRDILPAPTTLPAPSDLAADDIDTLPLQPSPAHWDAGFWQRFTPGEQGANDALDAFLPKIARYSDARDQPSILGTSSLSPHFHFGEISPRVVIQRLLDAGIDSSAAGPASFLSEIGWREFSYHLLFHRPNTPLQPLNPKFEVFPWAEVDPAELKAWQQGKTGIPLVDAGMRELWHTGTMHNRVRMVVASLLCKNLLIPWTDGAKWFWDTLVDADLAANTMGWQWVAGC
ncbi:MAG: deoxyribodipyrimidine photo-lyase, partial [Gammaproteobacteria bacterium]|nr:deoxyribodipyrimidine photo-lyase [Gammaproteobacteria bacterium]